MFLGAAIQVYQLWKKTSLSIEIMKIVVPCVPNNVPYTLQEGCSTFVAMLPAVKKLQECDAHIASAHVVRTLHANSSNWYSSKVERLQSLNT